MTTLKYTQVDFLLQDAIFKSVHNCKLCPYISKSSFFMRNHERRHRLSPTPFSCFENSPEIYHCAVCDFRTDCIKLLSKHIQQSHHVGEKREELSLSSYICRNCDFETYSRLHLLKHSKTDCVDADIEESEKEEAGTLCRSDFQEGEKNVKKQHKNKVSQNYKCEHCDFKSKRKRILKQHVISKHTKLEDIEWFKCGYCDFKVKHKSYIYGHVLSKHTKEEDIKWHKCGLCDYKAKWKSSIKMHMHLKHTKSEDIKWYKCEHCDYEGKYKSNLKTHILMKHTKNKDIKWHKCEHCDFKTKLKQTLKQHVVNNEEDIKWNKCEHYNFKTKLKSKFNMLVCFKHTKEGDIKMVQI